MFDKSNNSANTLINSISITTVHTVMKLAVDIQHPNRMIHNDFVDTLRCCLKGLHCPSANLSSTINVHILLQVALSSLRELSLLLHTVV